jgi:NAD(P)-dependent dehydrogenase (short-subunit alcohol dehydrogenase family)
MKLKPIEEQVVVIIGASSGIGRETALRFGRRGAKLVVAARGDEGLSTLVAELLGLGVKAIDVVADTSDFAQVQAVAERAVAEFGRIDTWVHAAATTIYARFEDTTPEEFKEIIDVNLNGQAYGAMAALPHLRREGRGALIHISSVEAKRALPYQGAYAASKHGIDGFLEALRMELMHEGVPINVVNVMPASINTPLFGTAKTKLGVKPKGVAPIYDPGIVADVILYAAEHPARDLYAGGAGKAVAIGQRISPALVDALMLMTAFEGQKTDERKSPDAPNTLDDGPIEGMHDRVEGEFSDQTRQTSIYTYLETHPSVALGAAVLGVGALALLGRAARG